MKEHVGSANKNQILYPVAVVTISDTFVAIVCQKLPLRFITITVTTDHLIYRAVNFVTANKS